MWLNSTIQEHDTSTVAKPNKRWRYLLYVYLGKAVADSMDLAISKGN